MPLLPTTSTTTLRKDRDLPLTVDGPFAVTNQLIAGLWLREVASLAEAVEWVKRCPSPHNDECESEIHQLFAAEDFGEALAPDMREREERLRTETARRA